MTCKIINKVVFYKEQFKANDVGRPMYHASGAITDRKLSPFDRIQMSNWARKFDQDKKEQRWRDEQIQAAKQALQNNQQPNYNNQPQNQYSPNNMANYQRTGGGFTGGYSGY